MNDRDSRHIRIPWYVLLLLLLATSGVTFVVTAIALLERTARIEHREEYYYFRSELKSQLYLLGLLNQGNLDAMREFIRGNIRSAGLTMLMAEDSLAEMYQEADRIPDRVIAWRRAGIEEAFKDTDRETVSDKDISRIVEIHLSRKEVPRFRSSDTDPK